MIRRLSIRTLALSAFAVAVVAPAGSIAAPDATASGSTWHLAQGRDKFIRFPQSRNCLPERRLWIGGGNWNWRVFIAPEHKPGQNKLRTRRIRLPSGWYRWNTCIDFPGGHRPMLQVTRIRSERTGGALRWANYPVYGAYGNRTYIWGSSLGRP
jgi:hypothetical protein